MRVWLYRALLMLALLLGSAAGSRAASPPQRCGLGPLASSQRQAIVSRSSLPTLALATAGTKLRRGHSPLPLAWIMPSWHGLSAPAAQRAVQLQLGQLAGPAPTRRGHGPRAPPQARPVVYLSK